VREDESMGATKGWNGGMKNGKEAERHGNHLGGDKKGNPPLSTVKH